MYGIEYYLLNQTQVRPTHFNGEYFDGLLSQS